MKLYQVIEMKVGKNLKETGVLVYTYHTREEAQEMFNNILEGHKIRPNIQKRDFEKIDDNYVKINIDDKNHYVLRMIETDEDNLKIRFLGF